MSLWEIIEGDSREVLKTYPDNHFSAVVTDPPYELKSSPNSQKGFMGLNWDGSGISFCVDFWKEILRVTKPGSYLIAFGHSRTWHRLACSLEDAGFIIKDSLIWMYSSGLTKSQDISKAIDNQSGKIGTDIIALKQKLIELFDKSGKTRNQIDKECGFRASNYLTLPHEDKRPDPWVRTLPSKEKWEIIKKVIVPHDDKTTDLELDGFFKRAEREIVGYREKTESWKYEGNRVYCNEGKDKKKILPITLPSTPQAKNWSGYGTALRPSFDPIILAQKPLEGIYAENIKTHHTGGLNIDACRIKLPEGEEVKVGFPNSGNGIVEWDRPWKKNQEKWDSYKKKALDKANQLGRWPGNLIIQHHPDCSCLGKEYILGHKGYPNGPKGKSHHYSSNKPSENVRPNAWEHPSTNPDGTETVEIWDCHEECPVKIINEQAGILQSGKPGVIRKGVNTSTSFSKESRSPGSAMVGYGDKGYASRFFYCPKSTKADKGDFNSHVCVKPTELMRWLVTLVTPPHEDAIILDPFFGSGSTGKACLLEGIKCVGIEQKPEYVSIAKMRLEEIDNKNNRSLFD